MKGAGDKYDVFSFHPNRLHPTPLTQGSQQIPEMFLRLPIGTILGQVYFDQVRVCDVVMTRRFIVDTEAKAAFVHHFHEATLSDYFRNGKQAATLTFPYQQKVDFLINFAARKLSGYGLERIERHLASRRNDQTFPPSDP
jgi:hypothetical protein